tara:strand:+ start:312 stop:899 length:588 start_codon:yes stop_codon:yes gene_type:complete
MTGKIYKLVGYGLNYYGSTKISLADRKSKHKYDYKTFVNGKSNYITSFDIVGKGDDWDIELVELVEDLNDLLTREGFYIKNNECVNKRIAGRTKQEYYKDNEEKMKTYKSQWAKDNLERIKEKYHENKTAINEKRRVHMSSVEMKLKKKEQGLKYRTENADKIKASKRIKIPCPTCNKEISKSNMSCHIRTQHAS